jgi:hypothetical protein
MTWNLVAQIGTLIIVGGLVVSGVASDIIGRIGKNKLEMANKAMELAKAHAEIHEAHTRERMPWDVN